MTAPTISQPPQQRKPVRHPKPPKLATERTGLNDRVANVIAKTVGSMWMFYASIIGFVVWMAGSSAYTSSASRPTSSLSRTPS